MEKDSQNKYYKTIKLKINCSKSDYKRLQECNKESAIIWNECLRLNRELYENEKKLMTKKELREITKNLTTTVICATNKFIIADKIFDTYKAIAKARKSGRTDLKYPWKNKRFYPTEWDKFRMHFDYDDNTINLTTTRYIGKDNKAHNGKQIILNFKTLIPKNIKTLKLKYEHGHFYACINYEVEQNIEYPNTNNIASIDLGEIHSITSVDNNSNSIIITGRKIRSIKQFRNKKYAKLQEKTSKCKKGSRQYKKYMRAKHKIASKCDRQIYYTIHKTTKMYVDWAVEKGISAVLIGDIDGIADNTKEKKIGSSNTRQKLKQWSYGQIMWCLEYKLKEHGISMVKVSEAYTSQTCPNCNSKYHPNNRNYVCPECGFTMHRDLVGAYNILRFNCDNSISAELPNEKELKYLRIV